MGSFGNPAASSARNMRLIPQSSGEIKILLSNLEETISITWLGSRAACRSPAYNLPLLNAVCFDQRFPNHTQSNEGQIVLPNGSLVEGAPIEMHSVNTRSAPGRGIVNVTDLYWCRTILK